MTTTNDVLARAREALANITPGEWTLDADERRSYANIFSVENVIVCVIPSRVLEYEYRNYPILRELVRADAAFIASAPALVRDLCALAEAQAARVAALERVLRLFADDKPGAIYRRFDDTYARQYCALCGSEWAVGESERHSAYCPVPAARALLEADHEAE